MGILIEEDDEIVFGAFHMERMDDDHIWFRIGGASFDLYASGGKLTWMPQAKDWEAAEIEMLSNES